MLSDLIQKSYSILNDNINDLRDVTYCYDVGKNLGCYWEVTKYIFANLLREWEEIAYHFRYLSSRFLAIFSNKVIRHINLEDSNLKQERSDDSSTAFSYSTSLNMQLSQETYYWAESHIPCELDKYRKKRENLKSLLSCKMIGKGPGKKYTIECLNQQITFGRISGRFSSGSHAFKNAFAALSVANGLCDSEAFMSHDFYKFFENFILQSVNLFDNENTLDYEVTSGDLRKALNALKNNQKKELQLLTNLASSVSILDDIEGLQVEYAHMKLIKGTRNSFTHAFILPNEVADVSKVQAKVSWITMVCEDDGVNAEWYQLDSNHIGNHFIGN